MTRTVRLTLSFLVAAACAAIADASTTQESFDNGSNVGGWTYGPPSVFETTGGNPGAYLHQPLVDTFAPELRTTGSSAFTGSFRDRNVESLGVDLITLSTQFSFQRELSLILVSGTRVIYFLGTSFVPQPGTGWKSFDFAIDSQSTTMPPGWAVLSGGTPDGTWNAVMNNVTQVRFFYGDPTFFFIFDQWNVGADNARITCADPWVDLGQGLAGSLGEPDLVGEGPLTAGAETKLSLSNAAPSSVAYLGVGVAALNAPFFGGTLVPDVNPPGFFLPLPTDALGQLTVAQPWPAGIPSGTKFYFQYWVVDPSGPLGATASNALEATTP